MNQSIRIPVTLFTGFLGSGKTTLLNRVVSDSAFADSVVIVNELGEISIDHLLIATSRENMFVLENGCLCCTVQGELVETLAGLLTQRGNDGVPAFGRVLVETTGLADPTPIIETLAAHPDIPRHYALHSVVTVVDGVNGPAQLEDFRESRRQVSVADRILISKIDLMAEDTLGSLVQRLHGMNPGAVMVEADARSADPRALFGVEFFEISQGRGNVSDWMRTNCLHQKTDYRSHEDNVQTSSVRHEKKVTRAGLLLWLDMLAGMKGRNLLRVKGVFNVESEPVAIHVVQRVIHEPMPLPAWPDHDRSSRIVFITRGISREVIERTLDVLDYEPPQADRLRVDPDAYARFVSAVGRFR